jgi:hypothetical protein
MAQAIRSLLEQPHLKRDLVKKGRELASTRTPEGYVRGVFAILGEFEAVRRAWK